MREYETLKINFEKRIGIISFNRPQVLNAINNKMIDEVTEVITKFNQDPKIACIIIKGEGRCFSAGFDMKEAAERSIKGKKEWRKVLTKDFEFIMQFWHSRKPTISAVHGYCLAGAFELMLACDITVASKETLFGEPEVRFGSGIITMLAPWISGPKHAKEMLLTGNDKFNSEYCLRIGAVNHVVNREELMGKAIEIGAQISQASDQSIELTKKAINKSYELANMNQALNEALEIDLQIESEESPERLTFNQIRKEKGLKEALAWRNSNFEN